MSSPIDGAGPFCKHGICVWERCPECELEMYLEMKDWDKDYTPVELPDE